MILGHNEAGYNEDVLHDIKFKRRNIEDNMKKKFVNKFEIPPRILELIVQADQSEIQRFLGKVRHYVRDDEESYEHTKIMTDVRVSIRKLAQYFFETTDLSGYRETNDVMFEFFVDLEAFGIMRPNIFICMRMKLLKLDCIIFENQVNLTEIYSCRNVINRNLKDLIDYKFIVPREEELPPGPNTPDAQPKRRVPHGPRVAEWPTRSIRLGTTEALHLWDP